MDWTLTGALGGVAILAITAGYELSVIARSNPEPAKEYRATPVLIPTPERPVVDANANAPAVGYTLQSNAPAIVSTPAPQADAPQVSSTAEPPHYPSRVESPPPIVTRPKDHSPPPDYPISGYKEAKPPPPPTEAADQPRYLGGPHHGESKLFQPGRAC